MKKVIIALMVCISIFSCTKENEQVTEQVESTMTNGDIIDTLLIEPYRHGALMMDNKSFEIIGAHVLTEDSTYSEDFILIEGITVDMIKDVYDKTGGPIQVITIYDPKIKMDKVIYNILYEKDSK